MKSTEETALMTKTEESYELSQSTMMAAAQMEVQGAIILAKKFPRDEQMTFAKLMKSCERYSFAEKAMYAYPRGETTVSGPSVNLAREAARVWGNIEYGLIIVRDDDESRHIRAWAWDKETNTKAFAEDSFKKLIQRKRGGKPTWIKPDERDLRELTNRRGAILVRNCILQLLPRDLVDDAINNIKETLEKKIKDDPEGSRKKIILGFSKFGITPEDIEKKLKHPIAQCTPEELSELRQIWESINDGNSKWAEYIEDDPSNGKDKGNGNKGKEKGSLNMADLKPKEEKKEPPKEEPKIDNPPPQTQLKIALEEFFGKDMDKQEKFLEEAVDKKILRTLSDDEVLKAMAKLKEKQIEQERKKS